MQLSHLTTLEQQALQQFKDAVLQTCAATNVTLTLFGSRARAEGNEDSDIDVLIVIDPYTEARKRAIWTDAYQVSINTAVYISPLVLSREQFDGLRQRERRIALDIARDGVPL